MIDPMRDHVVLSVTQRVSVSEYMSMYSEYIRSANILVLACASQSGRLWLCPRFYVCCVPMQKNTVECEDRIDNHVSEDARHDARVGARHDPIVSLSSFSQSRYQ